MNVNLDPQKLGSWFLRLLSLAGVALAAIDPNSLPASVRSTFVIAAGVILAVDRYVSDPTTGTPPPAPPQTPPTFKP